MLFWENETLHLKCLVTHDLIHTDYSLKPRESPVDHKVRIHYFFQLAVYFSGIEVVILIGYAVTLVLTIFTHSFTLKQSDPEKIQRRNIIRNKSPKLKKPAIVRLNSPCLLLSLKILKDNIWTYFQKVSPREVFSSRLPFQFSRELSIQHSTQMKPREWSASSTWKTWHP